MHRRFALVLVAVFVLLAAGCDWPYIVPPGNAPMRYRDPVFTSVSVKSNVTYGAAVNLSGQTVTLQFDMYQPSGDTVTQRPAIVWVHGGSFCCGDKTSPEIVDEANNFAKRGYFNVSINYRLESPGCSGTFSNCIAAIKEATADAQTAVEWVRSHARRYHVDPERIAIAGTSAGAIAALNVGYSTSETPAARVRAAVSLSGAQIAVGTISAGDAPALDFHGTADPLVPYQWAVNTITAAKAAGLDAYLVTWDGAGHVPYAQFHDQIIDMTTNFLWWEMDLKHAAH